MTVRLRAIVLGSAAGGGVPQWNCRCRVCRMAWKGDGSVRPRTQSSVAVSADGERWLLLNASPDIRQQIWSAPALHPQTGSRHSPIAAVLVTNGDVDHVTGLLGLRERQAFDLYGTDETLRTIADNQIFAVMAADCVTRRRVAFGEPFRPLPGLDIEIFPVPGKVPLWREDQSLRIGEEGENTVGVTISAGGARLVYIPGCAHVTDAVRARIDGADALFFDGTLYTDDEMIREGLGAKTGRRMGHISMSGPDGSAAALAGLTVGRRCFIHINNTNPVLIEGSPERRAMEEAGWEITHDGLEVVL
ncbi:pyrroloquinoline quinone biosynthesis protein PqqB [Prosthecodimorpha staleyi]|uniref:Coenzyme PQQ synthesis protein B n=1 Tax=Prosthecodimorpha staleyi TaxID=2840188 RepID=A0A947D6Z8_9HYPH|nr:pyrroloquinoline quinone biosynthesis protein PqqB [Prosthecodimorpha staleyi]MBT9291880.1 pyrroloquinoline quinone biosynthesis protein PqqB [Prosthecodimorpha staleyi]